MLRGKILLLLLWNLLIADAAAQYRFDAWTIDDGLPQNSIRAITQTGDGYLWLATLDGLARFDGVRFTVLNKATHKDLATTRFLSLFESADGALWLGTESSGAVRYLNNKFENFTVRDGLPADQTGEIYAESDGRIAIKTTEGVAYWKDEKFFAPGDNRPDQQRMIYYNPRTETRWTFELPNSLKRESPAGVENLTLPFSIKFLNQVRAYEDRSRALWISQNFGLWRFDGGKFEFFGQEKGFFGAASCFLEDAEGTFWIGTAQNGIFQFRDGKFSNMTTADNLSSNSINALFQDREGTIWVGTDNRGLNRLQKQLITAFSAKNGLSGVNVYPILADSAGRVWIGTQDGNLNLLENGAVRQIKIFGVRTLTEDRSGAIWICSKDGIFIYRDGALTRFNEKIPIDLGNNFVHAVQADRAGAIWFSSVVGLFGFQNGEWTHFNKIKGFPTDEARFVHEAANGDFYVGTYSGLVLMRRGENETQSSPARIFTTSDGLSSNHLRSIFEDADGVIWLGTYDGGLARLKDGKFTNFTAADGLYSDGVFAIMDDGRGNFWMSGNQGIHRISKRELNDFADGRINKLNGVGYGKRDGMLNAECNGGRQPAATKTADGRLWFATQEGAAIVDPKLLSYNDLPPPVVIENALIDREKIAIHDEIRLEPDQSNLEIQFTALSFIRSEQIRFRYKLEGLNEEWIDAGTRRDAYFSYLPPGDYRFVVSAANADGVWNEQGAGIRIIVIPPFYRTWWFIAFAAAAVSLFIFAVFRARINQLRREKTIAQDFSRRLIESQENERGRIAAELHDGLSQSLVIIKNRAALSLKKREHAEHVFEQLEEIAASATEAIDEAKEIIYNLRPVQLDRLGLTKAVESMLRRVSETQEIEFETFIDPLEGIFSKKAESSIYRILQESVNNIVRHSEASKVVIKIKLNSERVELSIQDNGRGFAVNAPNGAERGGFGLSGIKERARLLGGHAQIESEIGKGTSVKIDLPVRNDDDLNR